MKLTKHIAASLGIMLACAGFASCDDEVDYTPATAETDANAYFATTGSTTIVLIEDQTSVRLPVYRTSTEGSLTVGIECPSPASFFNIPAEVTFNDGSAVAYLEVTFPFASIEKNVAYVFDCKIEDGKKSVYGIGEKTFTVIYETWTSLGTGTYVEDILTTFFSVDNVSYSVEIQENSEMPGVYRLVNPYGAAYPYNESGDYDANENSYMVINASNPKRVYIETGETSTNWGYGNFVMSSVAYLRLSQGMTPEQVDELGVYGTMADGTITFPVSALLIAMTNYNSGSFYYANVNGKFLVALPGVDVKDYSVAVTYNGILIDPDETPHATGELSMGEDVETVRVAAVATDDEAEAHQAVINGTCAYAEIRNNGASHSVQIELAGTGDHTLIAVSYSDGKPKEYAFAKFTYRSADDGNWESMGIGAMADGWITPNFAYSDTEEQVMPTDFPFYVQIDRSLDTEGVYRLVNPYTSDYANADDYYFIGYSGNSNPKKAKLVIDASDPAYVYMDIQSSGYSDSYGRAWDICDMDGVYATMYDKSVIIAAGLVSSSIEDGIIYLTPMFYIDGEGPYNWDNSDIMSMIILPEEGASASEIAAKYRAARPSSFKSGFRMAPTLTEHASLAGKSIKTEAPKTLRPDERIGRFEMK